MTPDFSFTEEDPEVPADESKEEEANHVRSVIAPDVELKGQLTLRQGMEIAGSFQGSLNSSSTVRIMPQGKIEGAIEAVNVVIEGDAHAKMTARKRLEIRKDGLFVGTLDTQPEVILLSEFSTFGGNEESANSFRKEFIRDRTSSAVQETTDPDPDPQPETESE